MLIPSSWNKGRVGISHWLNSEKFGIIPGNLVSIKSFPVDGDIPLKRPRIVF
ncbi:Uncharacterized protein APZ42_000514 [Daphnia magna]|uniref:Uncharacterized protein n=1 Tax=Daphnia magna TaxID=35525 RepID=A0A164JKX0_9CRUS|nr:Uncharacterized protein APZ42_000514 [Daphnia magna]